MIKNKIIVDLTWGIRGGGKTNNWFNKLKLNFKIYFMKKNLKT